MAGSWGNSVRARRFASSQMLALQTVGWKDSGRGRWNLEGAAHSPGLLLWRSPRWRPGAQGSRQGCKHFFVALRWWPDSMGDTGLLPVARCVGTAGRATVLMGPLGNLGVGTGKRPYAARWPLCYQFSNLISPAAERGAHVCEGWGRGTPCQHPPRPRPTCAPVAPGEPGSL